MYSLSFLSHLCWGEVMQGTFINDKLRVPLYLLLSSHCGSFIECLVAVGPKWIGFEAPLSCP